MRKLFFFIILSFTILSACSNQDDTHITKDIIFQSEGKHWKATVQDTIVEFNGKSYFNINYYYKGNIEDLNKVNRISFAQGTELGTQIVNLYDPSYKEKLIAKDAYQEEYEEKYGIVIDKIQDRDKKEFIIKYILSKENDDYTILDVIKQNGINIIIKWETETSKYEESI